MTPSPNGPPDQSRAYRPAQAAERLNVCRTTVYALIRDKRLPVVKVGRATLIPEAAILRLLAGP